MSKAFKCDRCDEFFDEDGVQFKACNTSKCDCWFTFDLCPECAIRVMRFVKLKKPGLWPDGEKYVVADDLG